MTRTRSSARLGIPDSPPKTPPPKRPMRGGGSKKAAEKKGRHEPATVVGEVTLADDTVTGPAKCSASTSESALKRKLDESESEVEEASEAPTGGPDDVSMSDLSSLDESFLNAVDTTPKAKAKVVTTKPPKKKVREDHDAIMNVIGTRAGAPKAKPPVRGPGVGLMPHDMAAWMGALPETSIVEPPAPSSSAPRTSSSKPRAQPKAIDNKSRPTSGTLGESSLLSTKVIARNSVPTSEMRTKSVPPPPLAKPPKPTQAAPFEQPKDAKKKKKKGKQPVVVSKAKSVVESDGEESERAAALSSPPKGGARPTSNHVVEIKEEQATPRPARMGKFNVNIVEPTPQKNDQGANGPTVPVRNVDHKRGRKEKSKRRMAVSSSEDEGSEIELLDGPPASKQMLEVPAPSQEAGQSRRSRTRSVSPRRLKDLPKEVQNTWKTRFVPTLYYYQGAQSDPWRWIDSESVPVVQLIWDTIFGDEHPHRVTANDSVHGLATQKLWDWRSAFRSAAELVVANIFKEHKLTMDGRQMFGKKILEDTRFLYELPWDPTNKRLFRSEFFLTVLAPHLDVTRNAVEVPELFTQDGIRGDRPIGAMALAAAALERIFKLYSKRLVAPNDKGEWKVLQQLNPLTGNMSRALTEFNEGNFHGRTKFYSGNAKNMADSRLKGVLAAAQQFVTYKRGAPKDDLLLPHVADDDDVDERALLEDGDD